MAEERAVAAVVRFGEDAAPWLPDFLDLLRSRRGPKETIESVALVEGSRGRQFLLLEWKIHDARSSERIEVHLVVEASADSLLVKFLRQLDGHWVDFSFPGDGVPFPGEAAVVQVYSSDGGSAGGRERIIQLRRRSVDITPDWAGWPGDGRGLHDFDGDGTFEWWASTYVAMPHGCGREGCSGVRIDAILRRADGNFAPACRDFPEQYDNYSTRGAVDTLIGEALSDAQRGDFPAAWQSFAILERDFVAQTSLCCGYGWNIDDDYMLTGHLLSDVRTLIETAEILGDRACPLLAADALLSGNFDSPFLEGRPPAEVPE